MRPILIIAGTLQKNTTWIEQLILLKPSENADGFDLSSQVNQSRSNLQSTMTEIAWQQQKRQCPADQHLGLCMKNQIEKIENIQN